MDIKARIITPPQKFKLTDKKPAVLGKVGASGYRLVNNAAEAYLSVTAEEKIRETLSKLLGTKEEGEGTLIRLELGIAPADMPNSEQGYRLTAEEGEIVLTGFGNHGILYAAVTLCQMLALEDGEVILPALEITDWPDIERRGHQMESRYGTNVMEFEDWKTVIDDLMEKKNNIMSISLYGCWCVQYDGLISEYFFTSIPKYPDLKAPVVKKYYSPKQGKWINETITAPIAEKNFFGELCAYARTKGIELYPFFNTYGHNTFIPRLYPEVSAKFADGTPTGNGYCTSNPKTYEMLFDILDYIIDNFLTPNGVTSFDIGMDEIDDAGGTIGVNPDDLFGCYPAYCECEKCKDIPNYIKFVNHAMEVIKHLKEKGMKNVYICNDMFFRTFDPKRDFYVTPVIDNQRDDGDENSLIDTTADNYLPHFYSELKKNGLEDIVVMNWWKYTDIPQRMSYTTDDIRSSNLRTMIKPMNGYYHWDLHHPSVKNSYIMAGYANELKCSDYASYSCWDRIFDRANSAQGALAWNYAAAGTAEDCTRAFCARVFPTDVDTAVNAYNLLDLCNQEGFRTYEDGEKALDTRTLMERTCAYYINSYIAAGKPYPRNFPGESIDKILAKRQESEDLLNFVLGTGKTAACMFEKLANTPGCSRYFGQRLAWEANNISILAADYIALLRMHDLSVRGIDEEARNEIIALAQKRIDARLLHMEKAEEIKESYLIPSHLRNQSMLLQVFSDILSYVKVTAAQDIHIDFTDLSPIASKQFKILR